MVTVMLVFSTLLLQAQRQKGSAVTGTDKTDIINMISQKSASVTSMQCSFKQEKFVSVLAESSVSEGVMYYQSPNRLHWEYNTPKHYAFILNGDAMCYESDNSKKKIDAARNKSMSEMVKLIAGSLNGSGFSDSDNFKVDVFKNESSYCVVLSPLKKSMKNLLSEMAVFLNQSYLAESIEMTDVNGDITVITISSCKVNPDIPSEVFSIE